MLQNSVAKERHEQMVRRGYADMLCMERENAATLSMELGSPTDQQSAGLWEKSAYWWRIYYKACLRKTCFRTCLDGLRLEWSEGQMRFSPYGVNISCHFNRNSRRSLNSYSPRKIDYKGFCLRRCRFVVTLRKSPWCNLWGIYRDCTYYSVISRCSVL